MRSLTVLRACMVQACHRSTVNPKKYAHGFCFALLCCGYTLTDFPISIRLTSLALWQSNDCPSASKATLMYMDKYFMWIHYERLHNHNKAKHNKTVCTFLGIYCRLLFRPKIFAFSELTVLDIASFNDRRLFHSWLNSNCKWFDDLSWLVYTNIMIHRLESAIPWTSSSLQWRNGMANFSCTYPIYKCRFNYMFAIQGLMYILTIRTSTCRK